VRGPAAGEGVAHDGREGVQARRGGDLRFGFGFWVVWRAKEGAYVSERASERAEKKRKRKQKPKTKKNSRMNVSRLVISRHDSNESCTTPITGLLACGDTTLRGTIMISRISALLCVCVLCFLVFGFPVVSVFFPLVVSSRARKRPLFSLSPSLPQNIRPPPQ
jgi:hypothetical protein